MTAESHDSPATWAIVSLLGHKTHADEDERELCPVCCEYEDQCVCTEDANETAEYVVKPPPF